MNLRPVDAVLLQLVDRLELHAGPDESAYGDIDDYPTTMTVLDADPPSLMFAFWTGRTTAPELRLHETLQSRVNNGTTKISFDDGFAWLSLYYLENETAESIDGLLGDFTEALEASGSPPPVGCVACGDEETAESIVLEGRLVRICPGCVSSLEGERQRREEELNRVAPWHGLALPMVCTYVACGWMAFWLLVDFVMDKLNVQVIWIDAFTCMVGGIVLIAIGAVLGMPAGWVIRRSGLSRLSPQGVSGVVIVLCVLLGETLYIAGSMFRMAGVFNLRAAWQFLSPVLQNYPSFWVVAKLLTAGAITFGCILSAMARKTVSLADVTGANSK